MAGVDLRLEDCEPIWADPMHPVAVGGACEHGPLLLFEKFPGPKQFWGCSACRNPKTDCPDGFRWVKSSENGGKRARVDAGGTSARSVSSGNSSKGRSSSSSSSSGACGEAVHVRCTSVGWTVTPYTDINSTDGAATASEPSQRTSSTPPAAAAASRKRSSTDGAATASEPTLRTSSAPPAAAAASRKRSIRRYCKPCQEVVVDNNAGNHKGHDIVEGSALLRPTLLLQPKDNDKKNAQYFFAEESVTLVCNLLHSFGMKKVLCVGGPRIHEELLSRRRCWQGTSTSAAAAGSAPAATPGREGGGGGKYQRSGRGGGGGGGSQSNPVVTTRPPGSYLLDLDERFGHFFGADTFHLFNMFNVHSFNTAADSTTAAATATATATTTRAELVQLLSACDCIVLDPPFGGVLEALGRTIRWLWKVAAEASSSSDPRVGYTNHPTYHAHGKKSSRGSPVRIFTNVDPAQFKLPQSEGYSFCRLCRRWVHKENRHCNACKTCPSVDGRTWVHCDACGKCGKPGRVHCNTCKHCLPPDHDCDANAKRFRAGCHVCGSTKHRRQDCPEKK